MPDVLYSEVVEVHARVVPALSTKCKLMKDSWKTVKDATGEDIFIVNDINENKLKHDLKRLKKNGIESLAVVLMHSHL
jgi:N-methylhydantoinase A/oxoprolinase/acetone carboxylase beta subunit